jgi:nucleoside-diphosphate-sugar epimerase
MEESILVTGGNGFLGKQICKLINAQQTPVISISRSGKPLLINDADYNLVQWVSADIFDLDQWEQHLDHCKAIIHCIGIIEEQPDHGITYQKHIFEAAKLVGDAAKKHGINTFVYISAAAGAPDTPLAYIENKLASETYLNELGIGTVILKPGLIFGEEKPATLEEHKAIQLLLQDPDTASLIRHQRPLPVMTVARVAVAAANTLIRDHLLDVDGIEMTDALLTAEHL